METHPRRRFLRSLGAFTLATTAPRMAAAAPQAASAGTASTWKNVTSTVCNYAAAAHSIALPPGVVQDAKNRILDTIAATVSGASLLPGKKAIEFVRLQGGPPEATVVTTAISTSAIWAAFANGMCAQADETDDVESSSATHPGASVVPAVLAVGERDERSGKDALNAVVLGYDLCVRTVRAMGGFGGIRAAHRTPEAYGGSVGAAAAAALLLRLDAQGMSHALSYAIQQAGGVFTWPRDPDHVEKSFINAQSARNGVMAAMLAQIGFTSPSDVFDGVDNALSALGTKPAPAELTSDLGARFAVSDSTIKSHAVAGPIQSPIDALGKLIERHTLHAQDVDTLTVAVPPRVIPNVDNGVAPGTNLQHIMAVMLVDGRLTFEASHSHERMRDAKVVEIRTRIRLIGDSDPTLGEDARSARVEAHLRDGRVLTESTRYPPGSRQNPLSAAAVEAKARMLMEPALGARRVSEVIGSVRELETIKSIRELVALMRVSG